MICVCAYFFVEANGRLSVSLLLHSCCCVPLHQKKSDRAQGADPIDMLLIQVTVRDQTVWHPDFLNLPNSNQKSFPLLSQTL